MEMLRRLNDAQNNLNNAINDFSKGINPISAFTNYLGEQSIKGRIKNGGYATLDSDTDFEEDGRFKTTPLEWLLNQSDDDVRRIYEKEVLKQESADAAKYGYSLKDDKGKIKRPGDLVRDKTFYSNDGVQQAIEKGIDVDSKTDTIPRIGRKLIEKEKQDELASLGGSAVLTGPALERALNNARRRDKYGSLVKDENGNQLGTAQLDAAVEIDSQKKLLAAQNQSKYGDRLTSGMGTAVLDNTLERELKRGLADDAYHSLAGQRQRFVEDRTHKRNVFVEDRAYDRGVFESDRGFAQRVLENNNALDMRKFELEMQRDMSEDARQAGMINNLLGGLFSLGSLL